MSDQTTKPGQASPSPLVNKEQLDFSLEVSEAISSDNIVGELESHEVIELQTFSERKAWIEDKIKFLESLPPIEVFAALDAVRSSAEDIPGLPTRAELQRWVAEHDVIEKETEIFDTGELAKLRQLTKAATQRNLSPRDTDVIELTLTTIYELDKLLHLLRDRSENLEMLGIRLTWEEYRQAGWKERRKIIEDLGLFAVTRARWNPTIYEQPQKVEDSCELPRRGSVTSLASVASDLSATPSTFSRTARFKLAEVLSRDAAQFSGRVTSLRHGKVAAASKALDRLIDQSRKPVPEELLDEQDRLEEKCIDELENIGKFTLALVMQWRKADEIYVETMKDQVSASNLLEEIETASLHHPTSRQSSSFASRVDTILKRLAVRGDPASPASLFPRPDHPLFPDQKASNEALIRCLTLDIEKASQLAGKADKAAKTYRTSYEAVKRAETLLRDIQGISATLASIINKFKEGVSSDDRDGDPPDLTSEECLEPTRYSMFLALLPSLLEETIHAIKDADEQIKASPVVLFGLDLPGVDQAFRENAASDVQKLTVLRAQTLSIRDSVSKRVDRLRKARKINSNIDANLALIRNIRGQISEGIEAYRWRQESGGSDAPPTPESSTFELAAQDSNHPEFDDQLSVVGSRIIAEVKDPLSSLSPTLEPALEAHLIQMVHALEASLESTQHMLQLFVAVKDQSSTMNIIRDTFNTLLMRIEDSKARIHETIDEVPSTSSDNKGQTSLEMDEDIQAIQQEIKTFIDSLFKRVPFIGRPPSSPNRALKAPWLPIDPQAKSPATFDPSFDPWSVDASVRADSNSFAMRLNGALDILLQTRDHLELTKKVKEVDDALSRTFDDISNASLRLASQKSSVMHIPHHSLDSAPRYQVILDELLSSSERSEIARSFSPIRELLRQMDETSHKLELSIRQDLYVSRIAATDDAELRFKTWDQEFLEFKQEITLALEAELRHQEEIRLAEARQREAEEKRIAAEELERQKQERERVENEEKQRLLEERLAEERRRQLELARIAAESNFEAQISGLRKRLRSIGINEVVRSTKTSTSLPSQEQAQKMIQEFHLLSLEVHQLPPSIDNINLNTELRSLRTELADSSSLLEELEKLIILAGAVQSCDAVLSDLLEHIDSYPAVPLGILSSTHKSRPTAQPEEQLSARLGFTRAIINDMESKFAPVANEPRSISERSRILQTWDELEEMANDRIGGKKSRPVSATSTRNSSSRDTHTSDMNRSNLINPTTSARSRKKGSYTHLSVSSLSIPSRGKMLAPPQPGVRPIHSVSRRSVSGSNEPQNRSTSRLSAVSSSRSVSGPISTSIFGSTFASRQRTASLSGSNATPSPRRSSLAPPFQLTAENKRSNSPSMLENISNSHSSVRTSMNSTSSWSRAPRDSFSSILPRAATPHKKGIPPVRKKYVADPKSKLDVAVGDVVNQLPVGINIESVAQGWRDQSGKYWIGNQEPKLCFCRILRSQTVMVRVGGGWTELSKFIKDHFAESFQIAATESPRHGAQEQKWISSATLLEAPEIENSPPPPPPRTPEPTFPFTPSFSLMTPSGQSPRSLKSSPSIHGSPLTPLQYIRRAEPDNTLLRPVTPSKTPLRSRAIHPHTPSRPSVWRP